MWIKSEEGKLFNVSNAHAIVIEERQNGFVVLAEFNPTDMQLQPHQTHHAGSGLCKRWRKSRKRSKTSRRF